MPDEQPGSPPHPTLTDYYDRDEQRHAYVVDLFNRTAHHYDTVEKIFLNGGLWYRRFSLQPRRASSRGMKVLDVAIGTAAVSRGAAKLNRRRRGPRLRGGPHPWA